MWSRISSLIIYHWYSLDILGPELSDLRASLKPPTFSMQKMYGVQVCIATTNDVPSLEETVEEA